MDDGERADQQGDRGEREREVVRESEAGESALLALEPQEKLEADDEEEGREWAPLLDPLVNCDLVFGDGSKDGEDHHLV